MTLDVSLHIDINRIAGVSHVVHVKYCKAAPIFIGSNDDRFYAWLVVDALSHVWENRTVSFISVPIQSDCRLSY